MLLHAAAPCCSTLVHAAPCGCCCSLLLLHGHAELGAARMPCRVTTSSFFSPHLGARPPRGGRAARPHCEWAPVASGWHSPASRPCGINQTYHCRQRGVPCKAPFLSWCSLEPVACEALWCTGLYPGLQGQRHCPVVYGALVITPWPTGPCPLPCGLLLHVCDRSCGPRGCGGCSNGWFCMAVAFCI